MFAYVGTRTTRERNARGEGISLFSYEPAAARLELVEVTRGLVNPSFLAMSADHGKLYCIHGDRSEVSAFDVDRQSGRLRFINQQSTQGLNPVHLALSPCGAWLVVTNHLGASLVVLPVAGDGSLGPVMQKLPVEGPVGPHRLEQQQAKPHLADFDPGGRFVIVPDKGLDRVFSYRFEDGRLQPAEQPFAVAREGAGPRHAVFHPAKPLAYVVNELDSTVATYRFDPATGALSPVHVVPTLPSEFTGNSRGAAIAIDRAGKTLYASNRGQDSIAVFRLDAATGLPHFIRAEPSGGRTPRFFTLSPDGRHAFALNEDADTIVAYDVAPDSGGLNAPRHAAHCGSPVCIVFSNSPS